ncbi:transposable element Tc1 transposase [Trichonephila clavipes]|nr:transposable element Tc1 transposase [Trichonephila clavipes]
MTEKVPHREIRAHYEQLSEFERGRIIVKDADWANRRIAHHMAGSGWNHADWGPIVFSDESRFQLCPDDHPGRVWRSPRQRDDPVFTIAHPMDPQPGVIVWRATSFDSQTPLQHSGLIFQQDNARPHTVRVAMNCLTACQTLPWPAKSLSNRACLGYDGKATASNRECS